MRPSAFRWTSTGLLALLIVGTLTVLGVVSLDLVTAQNERTRVLVEQVARDLDRANAERQRAEHIARHAIRLEAHRLRLSILVDTCTVARLERQQIPRCRGVKARARRLAEVVREFRENLQPEPIPPAGGGGTTTVTKTKTASPPPNVGNSGNCPPSNPHCEEGDR